MVRKRNQLRRVRKEAISIIEDVLREELRELHEDQLLTEALESWMKELIESVSPDRWEDELSYLLGEWAQQGVQFSPQEIGELYRWVNDAKRATITERHLLSANESHSTFPLKGAAGIYLPRDSASTGASLLADQRTAYASAGLSDAIRVMPSGEVRWESRFRGPAVDSLVGHLDRDDRQYVLVHPGLGGGRVRLDALERAASSVNTAFVFHVLRGSPTDIIRAVLDGLRLNEEQRERIRAHHEAEEQRRQQEALDRIQNDPTRIHRHMDPRLELRPDGSVRPLGPVDESVRQQQIEAGSAGPIFVPGPGGEPRPLEDAEALHGTHEEFLRTLKAEIRKIIEEERDAGRTQVDKILDTVELIVDLIGLIPVIGIPADLTSAGISALRGDELGVSLALLAIAVDSAGLARIFRRLAGRVEHVNLSAKTIAEIQQFSKLLETGEAQRLAAAKVAHAITANKSFRNEALETVRKVHPNLTPHQAEEVLDALAAVGRAGEESGLQVVFRRDMPLRLAPSKQGQKVPIFGSSKSSSKTYLHAQTIDRLAGEFADKGDVAYIVLGDRSWRTATGRVASSNRRPDLVVVRKDGRVDAYEVLSNHDSVAILEARLKEGQRSLPARHQGDTDVFTLPKRE